VLQARHTSGRFIDLPVITTVKVKLSLCSPGQAPRTPKSLRLPELINNRLMKVARFTPPRTGRLYPHDSHDRDIQEFTTARAYSSD